MADTLRCRVLRKAAELLGGDADLGRHLQVPDAVLGPWLQGNEAPPTHVFLRAVDVLVNAGETKTSARAPQA
jgi:hypothetical protein